MKRYTFIAIFVVVAVQIVWIALYVVDRARFRAVVGAPVRVHVDEDGGEADSAIYLQILDDKLVSYAHETHSRERFREIAERDRWKESWGVIITVDDSIPGWQMLPVINHLREIGVKRIQIVPVTKSGEA